jgi:sugar phosphate isomerase/epimerase
MQVLLDLPGGEHSEQIGFWYDVGHAHAMDKLGFYPHEQWLKRFASRIIGVHLHDARGVKDHFAPGLGEIDFSMVARYLPSNAIRTLELNPFNTPEQISAGLEYLHQKGCVKNVILT